MRTEDGHIIYKCLNEDSTAFGLLVDKYKASIFSIAYSMLRNFHDAEDVTQDVFIKAYKNLSTLRRWDNFLSWLCSIAYNLCRDRIKAQSIRKENERLNRKSQKELDDSSVNSYREEQVFKSLHEALDSLPDIYREVLTLHYLGGISSEQIARILSIPYATVRQRLSRARTQLREEILTMVSEMYEQQRLKAIFTFRIVEMVKRIKVNPVSTMKGLPLGLSLATGIMIAFLGLGTHLDILSNLDMAVNSYLSGESKVLRVGEFPVDVLKVSNTPVISNGSLNNSGVESVVQNQNSYIMATKADKGKWQNKSDNPDPYYSSSSCTFNNKIYVIGGLNPNMLGVSTVMEYDPIQDKWSRKKDMPTPRACLLTIAVDDLIYAIGGFQDNRVDFPAVEVYDPSKDEWTRKKDMPTPRRLFAIGAVDGKIYCIGGCQLVPTFSMVEEYDIKTDTWARKTDMPTARFSPAYGVINKKIYVIGGAINDFVAIPTVEEYDPLSDKWTKKADMPTQRWSSGCAIINNEIYVMGGSTMGEANVNTSSIVEKYDPIQDKWYKMEDMLTKRLAITSTEFGNKIYVMGGGPYLGVNPTVEEYTSDTSSFSILFKGKYPTTWGELKSR